MTNEIYTAHVHGVPGERARATGVVRAIWPLLVSVFLCGIVLGAVVPRIGLGLAGVGFLAAGVFLVWAVRDGLRDLEGYFKGARGEEIVAALLATLPSGYHVFHDVAIGESGGIDHVVIGPNGLFVIETKCWSGQVTLEGGNVLFNGTLPSRSPIEQVRSSAYALTVFLSKRMEPVPVCRSIICFASNTLGGNVQKQDDTVLCNATVLLPLITTPAGHVSTDDIERIIKGMEQKAS